MYVHCQIVAITTATHKYCTDYRLAQAANAPWKIGADEDAGSGTRRYCSNTCLCGRLHYLLVDRKSDIHCIMAAIVCLSFCLFTLLTHSTSGKRGGGRCRIVQHIAKPHLQPFSDSDFAYFPHFFCVFSAAILLIDLLFLIILSRIITTLQSDRISVSDELMDWGGSKLTHLTDRM